MTQELYAIVTGLMVFACLLRWLTWKTINENTEDEADVEADKRMPEDT